MGRFILKRLGAGLITLWLATTIVFAIVNILPSNPGRQMLGAQAPEVEVVKLNEKLGFYRPKLDQYRDSLVDIATLNFGKSFKYDKPVTEILSGPLWRSAKLAFLALIITIPAGIFAGVFAARRQNKASDRVVVMASVATSSVPDFVNAAVISSLFCVTLGFGSVFATPDDDAGIIKQFQLLIWPALAMMLLYFGYIARMTRAGVINTLQSDYVRTATMKGLSGSEVMGKHVLRNALAPTITVISTQVGYLLGSILGVEVVFNYAGIGRTIREAVGTRDVPVLQGAVLIIAIVYVVANVLADLIIAYLNPRVRLGGAS
jgi:peptide/nickel transport system permease protein